jgi:hypothetical protein
VIISAKKSLTRSPDVDSSAAQVDADDPLHPVDQQIGDALIRRQHDGKYLAVRTGHMMLVAHGASRRIDDEQLIRLGGGHQQVCGRCGRARGRVCLLRHAERQRQCETCGPGAMRPCQ